VESWAQNVAAAHGHVDATLAFDGRAEKAIPHLELALRMSPHGLGNFLIYRALAAAHYYAGNYSYAISFGHKAVPSSHGFPQRPSCHKSRRRSALRCERLDARLRRPSARCRYTHAAHREYFQDILYQSAALDEIGSRRFLASSGQRVACPQ